MARKKVEQLGNEILDANSEKITLTNLHTNKLFVLNRVVSPYGSLEISLDQSNDAIVKRAEKLKYISITGGKRKGGTTNAL